MEYGLRRKVMHTRVESSPIGRPVESDKLLRCTDTYTSIIRHLDCNTSTVFEFEQNSTSIGRLDGLYGGRKLVRWCISFTEGVTFCINGALSMMEAYPHFQHMMMAPHVNLYMELGNAPSRQDMQHGYSGAAAEYANIY